MLAQGHFDDGFQAYQSRHVFNCDYIVSCIGLQPGTKARLHGVYKVVDRKPGAEVPLPDHLAYLKGVVATGWSEPEVIWYNLAKLDGFEDLEGHTIIEWGRSAKMWHQWATLKKDKLIISS